MLLDCPKTQTNLELKSLMDLDCPNLDLQDCQIVQYLAVGKCAVELVAEEHNQFDCLKDVGSLGIELGVVQDVALAEYEVDLDAECIAVEGLAGLAALAVAVVEHAEYVETDHKVENHLL